MNIQHIKDCEMQSKHAGVKMYGFKFIKKEKRLQIKDSKLPFQKARIEDQIKTKLKRQKEKK